MGATDHGSRGEEPSRYGFGEYVLDAQRRTLHRGDREIGIGARAFGVLELLVENAGRVVGKDELIEGVWREVAVTDDSLARAISDLRAALGDHASHPQYIRTVHRRGYTFVAPVTPVEDAAPSGAIQEHGPSRRSRNIPLLAALAALAVTSVVMLLRLVGPLGVGVDHIIPDFAAWRVRALGPTSFAATAIKPAFAKSSDLLSVVAPDPDTGVHSIFLLRPDGGEPLQLTRDLEVRGPAPEFTPDDSHIIFTLYHSDPEMGMVPDVWLAPVPAGEPALLLERASAASFGPDGRSLVYAAMTPRGTSIRVRHPDGREVEVAEKGFWPRWSPDGEWIAYTTSDPEGGDGTLHVVHPDGSEGRALTSVPTQMYGLAWTPGGERVIFASDHSGSSALWSVDVDRGGPIAVTRGPGGFTCPTMSPDGKRLVFDFDHRRWHLYLASEPDGEFRRLLEESGITATAVAPGGERVALALGAEEQSSAIAVLDVHTGDRRTISGMTATSLAWMPDGESLLVASAAPDGVSHWIWRLPVDGGLPDPVLKGEDYWDMPRASPDGSMLAAVRRSEGGDELVVRDLERGEDRTLAENVFIAAPRWSPDGRLLAWSGAWRPDDLASGGVWVCAARGGSLRRLTAEGAWPVWEEGGEHILFVRFLEHEGIWRVPVAGGPARLVRRLEGEMKQLSLEGLDIGRDGAPLMVFLSRFTGALYALEAPED